jgi:hypothetical protein
MSQRGSKYFKKRYAGVFWLMTCDALFLSSPFGSGAKLSKEAMGCLPCCFNVLSVGGEGRSQAHFIVC